MNQSQTTLKENQSIAWVEAGWHKDIVSQSRAGFSDRLAQNGIARERIARFDVPGSLEIPLKCKQLARTGNYQLIVAAGLIVDGGIYRHEFVAQCVLDGMMQVQLETDVPILSVVLTPHQFSSEASHVEYFTKHFRVKGVEVAEACLMMLG